MDRSSTNSPPLQQQSEADAAGSVRFSGLVFRLDGVERQGNRVGVVNFHSLSAMARAPGIGEDDLSRGGVVTDDQAKVLPGPHGP